MVELEQQNSSYMILSSNNMDDLLSVLYAKDYKVIPIKGYYHGIYEDSAIVFDDNDNNNLRKDVLFILNHFNEKCAIIKYQGESNAKKIFADGSEKPMGVVMYNTDSENISYLYNGYSFSFTESKVYWKPNKIEDFKVGMLVEYFNNDRWCEKKVENPTIEYNKMYKLLIKYDKIRVVSI